MKYHIFFLLETKKLGEHKWCSPSAMLLCLFNKQNIRCLLSRENFTNICEATVASLYNN